MLDNGRNGTLAKNIFLEADAPSSYPAKVRGSLDLALVAWEISRSDGLSVAVWLQSGALVYHAQGRLPLRPTVRAAALLGARVTSEAVNGLFSGLIVVYPHSISEFKINDNDFLAISLCILAKGFKKDVLERTHITAEPAADGIKIVVNAVRRILEED